MNLNEVIKLSEKPKLYEKGSKIMWTDEYISSQLLSIHLNEEIDLASRKKTSIDSTIDWILDKAKGQNLKILDLGCGPGLYAEIFAKKGHHVTGIDFSKNSIDYAKKEAEKKRLEINYINQSYLEMDFENEFDLVILIFTDLGVLIPAERDELLQKINKALKPDGTFIFDVLSEKNIEKKVSPKNWELTEQGFWRPDPYLALSESFLYEEEKVILYQHIVIEDSGNVGSYRFWTHFFSYDDLRNIITKHNYKEYSFHNDVLIGDDLWNGDNVTFCVAKR